MKGNMRNINENILLKNAIIKEKINNKSPTVVVSFPYLFQKFTH